MTKAGYCAICERNVWLTADGSCSSGHGPDQVSGAYDAPEPPPPPESQAPPSTPASSAPARKSRTGLIIGIAALVLFLLTCCCATIAVGIAIPAFTAAKVRAEQRTCFSNQRNIAAAAETYMATNQSYPAAISELVPDLLKTTPACPAGGKYEYDPESGRAPCSVHGSYEVDD